MLPMYGLFYLEWFKGERWATWTTWKWRQVHIPGPHGAHLGTPTSYPGKRKIIFKSAFLGEYVSSLEGICKQLFNKKQVGWGMICVFLSKHIYLKVCIAMLTNYAFSTCVYACWSIFNHIPFSENLVKMWTLPDSEDPDPPSRRPGGGVYGIFTSTVPYI